MSQSKPTINLILDFDGTITTEDTTAIIGSRCLAKAREVARPGLSQDQLPKSMQYYSDKYMQQYKEWKRSDSQLAEPKTIDDEVSRLSQSRDIEQNSFIRVRNAVLDVPGGIGELQQSGATLKDFMTDAGRQAIRNGEVHIRDSESLTRLIAEAEQADNRWGIVSVSWSRGFIMGALLESGLINERSEHIAKRIKCNELLAPHHVDGTGNLSMICSAQDKKDALTRLLKDIGASQPQNSPGSKNDDTEVTIYVGDSSTDLGCLAAADIGMYLHQAESQHDSVLQTLQRLEVKVLHATDLPASNVSFEISKMANESKRKGKPPHIICSVSGFDEIDEWLSKVVSAKLG